MIPIVWFLLLRLLTTGVTLTNGKNYYKYNYTEQHKKITEIVKGEIEQ